MLLPYLTNIDIAIGTPFGGEDRRGKVLIYNGQSTGLNSKPSQVLEGLWTSQSMPSGFGFTLRGGSDIDNNEYPGKNHIFQILITYCLSESNIPLMCWDIDGNFA